MLGKKQVPRCPNVISSSSLVLAFHATLASPLCPVSALNHAKLAAAIPHLTD
jgi:hypothetical protein